MPEVTKQDIVVKMVKEGIHTREEIKTAADCTAGALASYLSGMRNAAKYTGEAICPVQNENGIYSVVTFAEADAAKAEKVSIRTSAGPKKTPAERLAQAETRVTRCGNLLAKAKERLDENPDNRELQLRHQLAEINSELANIEFTKASAATVDDENTDNETGFESEESELI
jgi:hypothetical protein